MSGQTTLRAFTRVTLELEGPCHIGTGDESFSSDMPFFLDANGLPCVPGTSLAGMLRAAFERATSPEETDAWFGFQRGAEGRGSRVWFSAAHVHDDRDVPVDGQRREAPGRFLEHVAAGEVRDHVRIDAWGTADDRGKFDQQMLLRGTRFSFDLEIVGGPDDHEELARRRDQLLGLLDHPATRMGARVHSGLGRFTVKRARGDVFDLSQPDDFQRYSALPVALDEKLDLPILSFEKADLSEEIARVKVELTSRDFFVFGGGEPTNDMDPNQVPDILPVRTGQVWWSGSMGQLSEPVLHAPATAIKGALSHRVAFHANRLLGHFATRDEPLNTHAGENNPVVRELFGFMRDDEAEDPASGRVIVEDVLLEAQTRRMMHTSLDHYTQGVRMNLLFDEEVLEPGTKLDLELQIETPERLSSEACQALRYALQDLCEGRLALGAGESRGHGHFTGQITTWELPEEAANGDD